MGGQSIPIRERFWSKVNKTEGCWLWTAACSSNGYGSIVETVNGRRRVRVATRVSYELTYGAIDHGVCVLHKCDNPRCVRPDHLFLGSKGENNHDAIAKGHRVGTALDNIPVAIQDIRSRYAAGIPCRVMAKEYGLHKRTVERIARGLSWKAV